MKKNRKFSFFFKILVENIPNRCFLLKIYLLTLSVTPHGFIAAEIGTQSFYSIYTYYTEHDMKGEFSLFLIFYYYFFSDFNDLKFDFK